MPGCSLLRETRGRLCSCSLADCRNLRWLSFTWRSVCSSGGDQWWAVWSHDCALNTPYCFVPLLWTLIPGTRSSFDSRWTASVTKMRYLLLGEEIPSPSLEVSSVCWHDFYNIGFIRAVSHFYSSENWMSFCCCFAGFTEHFPAII